MNKILFFIILTGLISLAGVGALQTEFTLIPQDLKVFERDTVVACTCYDSSGNIITCVPPMPSVMCPPPPLVLPPPFP